MKPFPQNFHWGAASSAHQVEGNTHNNWSVWEKSNADRLAREAQNKWPDWIQEKFPEMHTPENYISGAACQQYTRYASDLDIAQSGNHNAHRFSLEWSRVEPVEGEWDTEAIAHYRDMIRAIRERGMEPFVTLWHWTHPLWLEARGGAIAKDFPEKFAQFAAKITEELGNEVTYWMTLNEPTSVIGNAYFGDNWPPQMKSKKAAARAFKSMGKAHRQGYDAIHAASQEHHDKAPMVGFTHIYVYNEPYRKTHPLDRAAAALANYIENTQMQKYGRGKQDFVALQYYFHNRIQFPHHNRNENNVVSDLNWEVYPEGIYHGIMDAQKFGVPIFVTESGIADADDSRRPQFLEDTIRWVNKAYADGADVQGYFYWSLTDNFEWDKGFWPRFGLVDIDYKTQKRTLRPSFDTYKQLIKKYTASAAQNATENTDA